MPDPCELIPNQIRLDLSGTFHQSREILASGLFGLKKVAPIGKGQRALVSPAVPEQSLEGISVLVNESAIIKFSTKPMAIKLCVII